MNEIKKVICLLVLINLIASQCNVLPTISSTTITQTLGETATLTTVNSENSIPLYIFSPKPLIFTAARAACITDGGNLASIHSDYERIRLFSVQTSSSLCDLCGVYTGLSRASNTEEFTWADGTPYDYTSFWVTNEPGD